MKINFLCVGAQKSGTTTLHDLLKQHQEIDLPAIKETKFFVDDDKFRRGLEFYFSQFNAEDQNEIIRGEIDPDYMYHAAAVKRIYDTLGGNIKLIFLLRNPVDRAYSQYLMNRKRYIENQSFAEALRLEKERLKKGDYHKQNFSYAARGFYTEQIQRFLNFYPANQILILIFEYFIEQKEKYLHDILQFIGAKNIDFKFNTAIKSNTAFVPRINLLNTIIYRDTFLNKYAKKFIKNKEYRRLVRNKIRLFLEKINNKKIKETELIPEIRNSMLTIFDRDIKALENLIGLKLNIWYEPELKT